MASSTTRPVVDSTVPSTPETMIVLIILPLEIWLEILTVVTTENSQPGLLAEVCLSWRALLERHLFSRIRLAPARLPSFLKLVQGDQRFASNVRYLWFCVELPKYRCEMCLATESDRVDIDTSARDTALIKESLIDLINTLSHFKPATKLTIDFSFYSPSDSTHGLKYPTFVPDYCGADLEWILRTQQSINDIPDDRQHGWLHGNQVAAPPEHSVCQIFGDIMEHVPSGMDDEGESEETDNGQWLDKLPLIPAIKCIYLRRQNRRYLSLDILRTLFSRFPSLEEIQYEP